MTMSDRPNRQVNSDTEPTPNGSSSEPAVKLSPVESIKQKSNFLRGTIGEELQNDEDSFGKDSLQLLKHHGTYQQDDRDQRNVKRPDGTKGKAYSMMLRTRIPGGRLTAEQFLVEMAIGDDFGNSTIRLTTRQAVQHHGILKSDLREVIHRINEAKMSTLAACGDVNRNIMCCPAPFKNQLRTDLETWTDKMTEHLSPQTRAYYELWLKDEATGEKELVGGAPESEIIEPIYGKTYLPRKFKMAFGLCDDNCIDIYTQDLGMLAVVRDEELIGFNVLVGGGMGTTPAKKQTFPAVAQRMAFIKPDECLSVAEAIVKVQRDNGNREDRKLARMKYLIHHWGLPRFKSEVENYFGQSLADPMADDVHGFDDHMGWHEQGDGNWFYGLNIENGRIYDDEEVQLKTALREICETLGKDVRVTSHQSLIFCDVADSERSSLESILAKYGVKRSEDYSKVRRWSMACVAWPTCGLAITESERALPGVMDELEVELSKLGLDAEDFTVRMTGCPNGCARPYNADVGLVGKAKDRYTVYLGGRLLGNRLGYIYKDLVERDQVVPELSLVFQLFKANRNEGETFGDFCDRVGKESLLEQTERIASAA